MITSKSFFTNTDTGILILRLTIGGMIFLHGWHKIGHGIADQTQMLVNNGIPGVLMYFVFISELLAPWLIILGIFTRLSALSIVVTMITILFVLPVPLLSLNEHGALNLELQLFYLLTPIALVFLGPGRYRVWQKDWGHWLLD